MNRTRPQIQGQGELFGSELFPVRRPVEIGRPVDLSLRVKTAMGRALKACPDSAAIVAARISEMTGRELTADALYAFTAPSKGEHDIGIVRFIAFVRATGAPWLWDLLVEDDGLVVLEGREAKLAQIGALEQQRILIEQQLADVRRDLVAQPVALKGRGRR